MSFVIDMVNIFLRQTPDFLNEMEQHASSKDWESFRKIVHKFKPTVGMMGIDLTPQISKLEVCAKTFENLDSVGPLLQEIKKICEAAYDELAVEIKSI
jgi:hypothetical protein